MPISFPCPCGKTLQVGDDFAGKRVRCPACRAVATAPPAAAPVPAAPPAPPPAEEDPGFDVVDEPPAEDHDFQVVEPPKPRAKPPAKRSGPPAKTGGKKKRPREGEKPGSMAAMYMAEARAQDARDEARAKAARRGDDDEPGGGGMTIGNVHFSAGMVGGFTLLLVGLGCVAVGILVGQENMDPADYFKCMGGGAVCVVLGLVGIVRGLFGAEEE